MTRSLFDIPLCNIDGESCSLEPYRGRVLLIVNVASYCYFTKQYHALNSLYKKYEDSGFTVLGFPCNQFGHQEPNTESQIKKFCWTRYEVSFPMFSKVEVNGRSAHPLFRLLKSSATGLLGNQRILWNFTKFLIKRDGVVYKRYGPQTAPFQIEPAIRALL
ncbi:glutathione peroxidase [Acidihalobacter prosperus]